MTRADRQNASMSLRVISGTAKGRKLLSVKGDLTRPVTDRVKESLFDIIGADVVGSRWWDMFAGTGAVGIEALSRGAAFARFTDLNREPIETIKANLTTTRLASLADVRRADAFKLIVSTADMVFDYVYVAPPQFKEHWSAALTSLDENSAWLSADAWVVIQISPREHHKLPLNTLQLIDSRTYGSTMLGFFSPKE